MTVELGDHEYRLEAPNACSRRSVVRGIALKNEELPLDEWIDGLTRDLLAEAQRSERGQTAPERLVA
jgi:hypothetical protein